MLARCTACQAEFLFDTCDKVDLIHPNRKRRLTWEYNAAIVMGEVSTEGRHASMEELFGTLGVPKKTFINIKLSSGILFKHYVNELILRAGKEEKLTAKQNGEFNCQSLLSLMLVGASEHINTHAMPTLVWE